MAIAKKKNLTRERGGKVMKGGGSRVRFCCSSFAKIFYVFLKNAKSKSFVEMEMLKTLKNKLTKKSTDEKSQ